MMNKLEGTINGSPEGNLASNGIAPCERLSGSIRVISSPKTLDILARLISSIIITKFLRVTFSDSSTSLGKSLIIAA